MGNIVGALKGQAFRKLRRFNIESRTDSFLDKNVKNPPPKPQATQREIEKLNREMPNLMTEITSPNPELLDRLKDVYVSSTDVPVEKPRDVDPKRPLPLERKSKFLQYNYVEPESTPPGRLSLHQALQLLSKYQSNKKEHTVAKLAMEYDLKKEDVDNLVDYFRLYTLVEAENQVAKGDAHPYLEEPEPNVPINVVTFPEYAKKLLLRDQKKDALENESVREAKAGNETEKVAEETKNVEKK